MLLHCFCVLEASLLTCAAVFSFCEVLFAQKTRSSHYSCCSQSVWQPQIALSLCWTSSGVSCVNSMYPVSITYSSEATDQFGEAVWLLREQIIKSYCGSFCSSVFCKQFRSAYFILLHTAAAAECAVCALCVYGNFALSVSGSCSQVDGHSAMYISKIRFKKFEVQFILFIVFKSQRLKYIEIILSQFSSCFLLSPLSGFP